MGSRLGMVPAAGAGVPAALDGERGWCRSGLPVGVVPGGFDVGAGVGGGGTT